MTDLNTIAAKGLREPAGLKPEEIKQLADKVSKEAHANEKAAAAAKKAEHDAKSLKPEEIKELAAHVLGESSHAHKKG